MLQPKEEKIVNFERDAYKALCEEMRVVLQTEKELKVRKEELRNELIKMSGGDRMEYGIKITYKVNKGTIDYKALAQTHIAEDILKTECENFRKKDVCFWEVKNY